MKNWIIVISISAGLLISAAMQAVAINESSTNNSPSSSLQSF